MATRRGARHRDRQRADRSSSSSGPRSPDEQVDALLADDRARRSAATTCASARRYRPHLLTEPEERDPHREVASPARSAWERLFDELTSAIDGRRSTATRPCSLEAGPRRGCSHPTATVRQRPRPRRSPRASSPGCARARSCSTRCSPTRRSTTACAATRSWIASRNLANEASDESVQALVDAVQRRYDIPQRWYTLKAQLLGLDRSPTTTAWRRSPTPRASSAGTRRRDLVLDAYASFSPELADVAAAVLRRVVDRRAGAAGQATRRVLRVHGAVAPPVRAAQLDGPPARRAHARPRARPRPARVPRARAGRVPPDDAAHAGRDRVGVRRDGHVRPAARRHRRSRGAARAAGREPRGPDRHRVPPDRDEPLRGRGAHAAARRGRAVGRPLRRAVGATRRPTMLGDSVEITEGYRTWWSYIPHFIGTPGLRVRVRVRPAARARRCTAQYEERGDEFVPQYLELLAAGGSRSPEELGRIVGVDLADPGVLGRRPRHRRASSSTRPRPRRRPAVGSGRGLRDQRPSAATGRGRAPGSR